MTHNYYLLSEDKRDLIITTLDHIRVYSMDRGIIADDCEKIESILVGLGSI